MSLFRCAGDIIFENVEPLPGQICKVRLKQFSETCNFLQHMNPLTPQHPYFFAQIRALAPKSRITIGIAGPDIAEDAHPGSWINSVGYQSDSGKCYSSHHWIGNTRGEQFGIGDVFGVLVTYFGESSSTVMFLKNGYPVATRFLTESDHNRFLPTISLQHGPIELGLMWPEAAVGIPKYSETNMLHWIKPRSVVYDMETNVFSYNGKENEVTIQSPHPLSTEIGHFEVILREVSESGYGPAIALGTCSPLLPSSPNPLLNDFIYFHPTGEKVQLKVGERMGWGVHYHKHARSQPNFDPHAQQLVLCYVTVNITIVHIQVVMQPPGGLYPLVALNFRATKASVDIETNPQPKGLKSFLDQKFEEKYQQGTALVAETILASKVDKSMLRHSESIEISMSDTFCHIRLPGSAKGIHVIQFLSPLTEEKNYFCCKIRKLNEDSTLSVGVASRDLPLNKHPGKVRPSVGWHSRMAKILRNDRSDGNLSGHRCCRGDFIGVEMEAFAKEMSVALFRCNGRPVGTGYYTQPDRSEFLPTIGLCSNGYDIDIDVCWQNMNRGARNFHVDMLEYWCLPPGAVVEKESTMVCVPDHVGPLAIQSPYSLRKSFNHFEIRLVDDFGEEVPPPAIVLSTASPLDPPPVSNFKVDFLRFWAINEAAHTVKKGDLVGWGLVYIEEGVGQHEEQLVLCYLTVNRNVLLVQVVYQPPGGFYPLVILPQKVNRVQLEFSALCFDEHPFSRQDIEYLVSKTKKLMDKENQAIAEGRDPHDLGFDMNKLAQAPPKLGDNRGRSEMLWSEVAKSRNLRRDTKVDRLATVVKDVMQTSKVKQNGKVKGQKSKVMGSQEMDDAQKGSKTCVVL